MGSHGICGVCFCTRVAEVQNLKSWICIPYSIRRGRYAPKSCFPTTKQKPEEDDMNTWPRGPLAISARSLVSCLLILPFTWPHLQSTTCGWTAVLLQDVKLLSIPSSCLEKCTFQDLWFNGEEHHELTAHHAEFEGKAVWTLSSKEFDRSNMGKQPWKATAKATNTRGW